MVGEMERLRCGDGEAVGGGLRVLVRLLLGAWLMELDSENVLVLVRELLAAALLDGDGV